MEGNRAKERACVSVCAARGFGAPVAHLLHMGWQGPGGQGREMRHRRFIGGVCT